ncbi:MAG: NAD(P)H-dependent glycerol-3-phosphate dehydrogenase [Bacteroidales bacterium]|nr:NAD(P)H-dependent glycerol-3-phosphate dehydrogenase [Bacteroidales bacterium]
MSKIAVLGDGSWATAIVKILNDNNHNINWNIRLEDDIEYIRKHRRNPNYLTGVELHLDKIKLFNNIEQALEGVDTVIIVIPSAYLHEALQNVKRTAFNNLFIVSAVKGIVPDYYVTPLEYMKNVFDLKDDQFGVISGPSHAEEIALERLTYLTASAENQEKADYLARLFACHYTKTTTSDDIYGTEYAAIMKNIMAVASGIAHGLGYGDNFQAVLISNAIREIKSFVDLVHPITRDIKNSVYLGDLLVTAYSTFSRNRTFGNMIGKGYSVKAAQLEMNMVAEGYYAVKGIFEINKKYNIKLPITEAVYNILYDRISPRIEMNILKDQLD